MSEQEQALETSEQVTAPEVVTEQLQEQTAVTTQEMENAEQETAPSPKMWKLKFGEEELEKTEEELLQLAQAGLGFTKKSQGLSEYEKSVNDKVRLAEQMLSDPMTFKWQVAKNANIPIESLFITPQQPPEWLKETDPVAYGEQMANFKMQLLQKQYVDATLQQTMQRYVVENNTALINKARIDSDLNETQTNQLMQTLNTFYRPNDYGMFTREQVDMATRALFGVNAVRDTKLQTSNNLVKSIKKSVGNIGNQSLNAKKSERLSQRQKDDREFLDFVQGSIS